MVALGSLRDDPSLGSLSLIGAACSRSLFQQPEILPLDLEERAAAYVPTKQGWEQSVGKTPRATLNQAAFSQDLDG